MAVGTAAAGVAEGVGDAVLTLNQLRGRGGACSPPLDVPTLLLHICEDGSLIHVRGTLHEVLAELGGKVDGVPVLENMAAKDAEVAGDGADDVVVAKVVEAGPLGTGSEVVQNIGERLGLGIV